MKNSYKERVLELYPNAVFLQYNGWMQIFDNISFTEYSQIRLKSRFDEDDTCHFNHIENDAWKKAWQNIQTGNIILSSLSEEEKLEIHNYICQKCLYVNVKIKKCGIIFSARLADVNRGWAKFCSKSCKAIVQEKRTGQYANLIHNGDNNDYDDYEGGGWDAHKL